MTDIGSSSAATASAFSFARQSIGRRGCRRSQKARDGKAKSFTLDGEAVVVGPNGLTDFEALRRRGSGDVAVLYVFDLLEYDGSDLRRMPLEAAVAKLSGSI
jgi:hypothetical protein